MILHKWKWTPKKGFGPIKFGDSIEKYTKQFQFCADLPEDTVTSWKSYKIQGEEVFISTEQGKIVEIASYNQFIYKSCNLIGTRRDDLIALLGEPDEIGESTLFKNGVIQTPLEYFSLGLEIWIEEEIVVLASCIDGTN